MVQQAGNRLASASLVARRYAQRGYALIAAPDVSDAHELTTFSAEDEGRIVGTLSVRFDGPKGLAADGVFAAEVAELRQGCEQLCEFTRLALESQGPSKAVLARLFQTTYVYAHKRRGADRMVIEVNPRHVAFYRRMLGLRVVGEPRFNPRVKAMAVLMVLDFAHVREQVERLGGQPALASVARTLYPYTVTPKEEADLV
ncbi:MAG TPA: hypothetical protein VGE47_08315 [Burkholderiaceae bacterium]